MLWYKYRMSGMEGRIDKILLFAKADLYVELWSVRLGMREARTEGGR
jgi:hypothetical protein